MADIVAQNAPSKMTISPINDCGQMIAPPVGKIIGYLDSKTANEDFAKAIVSAGFQKSRISCLHGEDGIHLLERLKENTFFFSDAEDNVIRLSIHELKLGHFVTSVDVADRTEAMRIVTLARSQGGHGFSYFGTWVSESLQHDI